MKGIQVTSTQKREKKKPLKEYAMHVEWSFVCNDKQGGVMESELDEQ
jgi:hypothetical protein